MSEIRFYITIFTLIAVLMAGVSPVCAFMFGKSDFLLEICAADGSVQNIAVNAAEHDPFTEDIPIEDTLETMEQCAFCFAAAHQIADSPQHNIIANVPLPQSYLRISNGISAPHSADHGPHSPRAPPALS